MAFTYRKVKTSKNLKTGFAFTSYLIFLSSLNYDVIKSLFYKETVSPKTEVKNQTEYMLGLNPIFLHVRNLANLISASSISPRAQFFRELNFPLN